MYHPRISIVTPSFNQGAYIQKTIESVFSQGYPNLEYIIIDGGSTDCSVELIKKYESHLAYWVSEGDSGQSQALNKGFAQATGEIVGWLNSDDWYEPGAFEIVAKAFEDQSVNILAGNCRMEYEGRPEKNFIDKPGLINLQRLAQYWEPFFCPPQPAIFFRRAVLERTGRVNEELTYGMDLDLWMRFAKKYKFHYVDQLLANYLIHESSKSGSGNGFAKFEAEWKAVVEQHVANASWYNQLRFWWNKRSQKVQ